VAPAGTLAVAGGASAERDSGVGGARERGRTWADRSIAEIGQIGTRSAPDGGPGAPPDDWGNDVGLLALAY
jgi:hypothetical protein